MDFVAPDIDYAGISPIITLTAGIVAVLMAGLMDGERTRFLLTGLSWATLAIAAGLCIWLWGDPQDLISGTLRLDDLSLAIALIVIGAAFFVIPLTLREPAANLSGHGETHALLLSTVLGMVLLAMAQNLISFFVALELLSIPLYVLCGLARNRRSSLESGLKYLIIGSLGSAVLLYGLAFIYGGSGSTDFVEIGTQIAEQGITEDVLILVGIALAITGLAFKLSIAPFHLWTPDVYEGAPTPITAIMSVATKAAAFIVFVRFFDVALGAAVDDWQPALAALAVASIVVGNAGALGQSSLKRLLGYSGIAQAGYMLVGLLVATELGVSALVFYLAAYTLMNLPAFAVIVIRERETPLGDNIQAIQGLGRDRPLLAWPLTISMLALAGLPGTAGFIGKLFLIEAAVDGGYTWLGVAIVVGTMVSLVYYLRVIAAIWMRPAPDSSAAQMPAMAGGAPNPENADPDEKRVSWLQVIRASDRGESADPPGSGAGSDTSADAELPPMAGGATVKVIPGQALSGGPSGSRCALILVPTVVATAATIFFGVIPSPLVNWASEAGASLASFF